MIHPIETLIWPKVTITGTAARPVYHLMVNGREIATWVGYGLP